MSLLLALALLAADAPRPFAIKVVDDRTGRGVPLVELETVNHIRLVTDSNGLVAFDEPGLVGRKVFFHVRSHGYEFAADGFGYRGKALEVVAGGSATLKIRRENVAERLYRVTGGGIYRDTVLLGIDPPIGEPVLNGQVLGQDSVINAVYRGKLRWFWGDTNRPGYPLGNFHTPGATSLLPADGGLDPSVGVDLAYLVDADGFARPTAKLAGDGPTWISGPIVLRESSGAERMFTHFVKVKPPLSVYAHGLAEWDDAAESFREVVRFAEDAPAYPHGQAFLHREGGLDYAYFATPYPLMRVRAKPEALADLSQYETFTCLKSGTQAADLDIDRDDTGRPRYAWRRNAPILDQNRQDDLAKTGDLDAAAALLPLRDFETGRRVLAHGGSVCWNEYRRRWVMIAVESFGSSFLGEVWFAEADRLEGPWVYARKVVTHEKYSFYNPKQHPYFDQDGGRRIYFEGTYTTTFSGNDHPTPRYDYNQIMYRLDLDDPRVNLPVAIESIEADGEPLRFGTVRREAPPGARRSVAFFALDRPRDDAVPIYETADGTLTAERPADAEPLFYGLSADVKEPPATTVVLLSRPGREETPAIARVWTNPVPRLELPRP